MIMSTIVSSTFFVFLLMCLSMHASSARNLGVVDKDVSGLEYFVVSNKVQLKAAESIQGRGGINGEKIDDHDMVKASGETTTQNKQKDSTYIGGKIPGLVPVKLPLVSVSFMPRKNLYDEHPGFYSDYSRPGTRPPSHN